MSQSPYQQISFNGGMNLAIDSSRIAQNEYRFAYNLRNRYDLLEPIKDHRELTGAPIGNKQGLYAINDYLILFNDGKCYYKIPTSESWTQIDGIQMDADVKRIYAQVVPVSVLNFKRTDEDYDLTVAVNGTPQAMVIQDGINQPWLLFPDLTNRAAGTYDAWVLETNQEYVPIGTLMTYFNGILFIVSPDGSIIYRSVTGRPLDFVVNIAPDGTKGGDATTTSYAVDLEPISCITQLNTQALFVSTKRNSYAVQLDQGRKIFNEPTFVRTALFPIGAINQFSFTDILGDFGFIDIRGLRSFNAVQQLGFLGQNALFSSTIGPIFENTLQDPDECCAGAFDNYIFFSVNTTIGPTVVVYDTLAKQYVCFEKTVVFPIKQFAALTPTAFRCYAITPNKVYELYGSEDNLTATVELRSNAADNPIVEQKPSILRAVVKDTEEDGSIYAQCFVDEKFTVMKNKPLNAVIAGIDYPAIYPVMFSNVRRLQNIVLRFDNGGLHGYEVSYILRWTGGGKLVSVTMLNPNYVNEQSFNEQTAVTV